MLHASLVQVRLVVGQVVAQAASQNPRLHVGQQPQRHPAPKHPMLRDLLLASLELGDHGSPPAVRQLEGAARQLRKVTLL